MMILAGLGNYEPKYLRNRHNVGFMALDIIAQAWSAGPWRKRFQGLTTEITIGSNKLLLLKPQTFYNNAGQSVGIVVEGGRRRGELLSGQARGHCGLP